MGATPCWRFSLYFMGRGWTEGDDWQQPPGTFRGRFTFTFQANQEANTHTLPVTLYVSSAVCVGPSSNSRWLMVTGLALAHLLPEPSQPELTLQGASEHVPRLLT